MKKNRKKNKQNKSRDDEGINVSFVTYVIYKMKPN